MILSVGWIFQLRLVYLFESMIWLNSANFLVKTMVLRNKEAPKPDSTGGFELKN